MAERCNVVHDYTCTIQTRCRCFACGLPVCKVCSLVVDWGRWKRKRICLRCHDEEVRLNVHPR
jgi:hypothetical protein